ncbi:hypothetical protein GWO13_10180 [Candidatus Bathyarchaeota archaeon]|nr:hypothetical protein [Candidatus Bathyarchaeota archaeon]
MANEAKKARVVLRKDGKCFIYLPADLSKDSRFPFKDYDSIPVKISFKVGDDKLIIEKWEERK